ncbi:MAG: T9SS type A sorting domain-containing protein [bacterium]|nr:T9SS type A sorting domain-containing protein [bacterium]
MTNPMRLLVPVILLIILLIPQALLAAPPEVDTQEALRHTLTDHRDQESAMKERLAKQLLLNPKTRTANQEDFDVLHYDLDMAVNTASNRFSGTLTATVEVIGAEISTIDLDFVTSMTVSAATCGGSAATWSHASSLLTIDLDRTYTTGEQVTVSATYDGNTGATVTWSSHQGNEAIWTLSEPYGARDWWPCKDDNRDKPETMDIRVTVPDDLIVASNGTLISDVDNGATRTFHWHSQYPIATYLVSLAIHPYTVYSDWYTPQAGGDPMEVAFYVYPDNYSASQANYALTVPMIDYFAQEYGEYPFVEEKYGHADFGWGGGMEHQTMTSMGGWSEDLISHELGHQWWGDMVTCADFHHIWLNEGFATWSEAYWAEDRYGFESYKNYLEISAYMGGGTIYVEDTVNDNIFSRDLTYDKASWIPHMLRGIMGDETFFEAVRHYRSEYLYSSATTEQFRDCMEAICGIDLDAFFQQWIYGEYFPVYRYSWNQSGSTLNLNIRQVQDNTGLFTMPIKLVVETSTGTYDFTVQNSLADEDYQLTVDGDIADVILDPDKWILRRVETSVSNPTFADGILLVNGVDWPTYEGQIENAYEALAFWGDNEIDFWDNFSEPSGGYPSTLPAPLGHGAVPATTLARYSTVIWIGNNYNGDISDWFETPIESYLEVGGNVLLMTRRASTFIGSSLTDYLGISWTDIDGTLGNCIAVHPDLTDVTFTGAQSYSDVFSTAVGPNSTLLTKDTTGFSGQRGTGVHAQPPGGGSARPDGGQFVLLSGRPYRMNHTSLRANVEFILEDYFAEPWTPTAAPETPAVAKLTLSANHPNPFNPTTLIPYALPRSGDAELAIYDTAGRLVKVLVSGHQAAGEYSATWHGLDDAGRPVASGVYFTRLRAGEETQLQRMVLLR